MTESKSLSVQRLENEKTVINKIANHFKISNWRSKPETISLYRELRRFFNRLPIGAHGNLVIEDLFTFLSDHSHLSLLQLIEYLKTPPWTERLADFGKMPNHPYILIFNPFQELTLNPIIPEGAKPDADVNLNENEINANQKEMDEIIFGEKLRQKSVLVKCKTCGRAETMQRQEIQNRKSDEPAKYLYNCTKCDPV